MPAKRRRKDAAPTVPGSPISFEGFVAGRIKENGETREANSPLTLAVDSAGTIKGHPGRTVLTVNTPAEWRLVEGIIRHLEPPPPPRPVLAVPKPIDECMTRVEESATYMRCPRCGGAGWLLVSRTATETEACESCDGSGLILRPDYAE